MCGIVGIYLKSKKFEKDLGKRPININASSPVKELNTDEGCWISVQDLSGIFTEADAVLILTGWEEYKQINWNNVAKVMRKPSWVFDSRSIVDSEKVIKAKLNLWRVGDGSIQNKH